MTGIAMVERAKTAIELGESHFREFKSGLEGEPGQKRKRPIKEIATNIAQTLVAFANADGGELLVGVEDSGEITGLPGFSLADFEQLNAAPTVRVHADTPLPTVKKQKLIIDSKEILYFSVPKSTTFVHVTSDGRCLLRRDLESVPVSAESIQLDRKEQRSREYDRQFVDGVSADDLNLDLVRAVANQLLKGMSPEKCLQYLELGEYGLSQLRLRRGALLLFSKQPSKWHPRLQIRILKVDGDILKTGENYNVVSDQTISGNILSLVENAWEALRPHLVHTRFDSTARFEQRSIYPEHACREALLNAIAHRDYSDEGRGIEVFVYETHLEIKNPGGLLSSIRIEDLSAQKGVHQSRNTNVARVLRELGYMRELGEGMRRIFDLMRKNELTPPVLESTSEGFTITLTHTPLYGPAELLWLSQFDAFGLSREHKAVVLLGQNERIFSMQQIWDAVGIVDTEDYRKLVDSLLRSKILVNTVDRFRAKRIARSKKISFREFPRYGIEIPQPDTVRRPITSNTPTTREEVELCEQESIRLYIGNLPNTITKSDLIEAFSVFGDVKEAYLAKRGKLSKGYGFIEFPSNEAAEAALAKDGLLFEGRKLIIRQAVPNPSIGVSNEV